ncbi:hypothetical protein ABFS82_06G081600 [Erythranthe guttata]
MNYLTNFCFNIFCCEGTTKQEGKEVKIDRLPTDGHFSIICNLLDFSSIIALDLVENICSKYKGFLFFPVLLFTISNLLTQLGPILMKIVSRRIMQNSVTTHAAHANTKTSYKNDYLRK